VHNEDFDWAPSVSTSANGFNNGVTVRQKLAGNADVARTHRYSLPKTRAMRLESFCEQPLDLSVIMKDAVISEAAPHTGLNSRNSSRLSDIEPGK